MKKITKIEIFNAEEIKSDFKNYRTREDALSERLKAKIKADGYLREPIHVDKNFQCFSGYNRFLIAKDLNLPIPCIVHDDMDLSLMSRSDLDMLQVSHNIRVKDKPADLLRVIKDAFMNGKDVPWIASSVGLTQKEVYVYLKIKDYNVTVQKMIKGGVAKNNWAEFSKEKNEDFIMDETYQNLFLDLSGEDLKREIAKYKDTKKLESLTKGNKNTVKFVAVPCINVNTLKSKQSELLDSAENILDSLETLPEEQEGLKSALEYVCHTIKSIYEMDAGSVTKKRLEHEKNAQKVRDSEKRLAKKINNYTQV